MIVPIIIAVGALVSLFYLLENYFLDKNKIINIDDTPFLERCVYYTLMIMAMLSFVLFIPYFLFYSFYVYPMLILLFAFLAYEILNGKGSLFCDRKKNPKKRK